MIVVAGGLVIVELGWSAVIGLFLVLLLFPLQTAIGGHIAKIRAQTVKVTDARVKTMSDVLSAIKLVKFCTWEDSFSQKVEKLRTNEVTWMRYAKLLKVVNESFSILAPSICTFIMLAVYSFLGNQITSSKAFTSIALINLIRLSLIRAPNFVKALADSWITWDRIQTYLLYNELQDKRDYNPDSTDIKVEVKNAYFSFDDYVKKDGDDNVGNKSDEDHVELDTGSSVPTKVSVLKNINMVVRPTDLVAVVGNVGSGKSSLLHAILGQVQMDSGTVIVNGKIAHATQQPWLINASLKNNILFGSPFDRRKYERVIKQCQLKTDLELLPDGDETEIGERGINLSGGQKQRVSLARAIYADRDIYLLDDPLSAVDQHVGNKLFYKCINRLKVDKAVIFATNQLAYLKDCTHIIYLEGGTIAASGTLQQLLKDNKNFADLYSKYSSADIEEELQADAEVENKVIDNDLNESSELSKSQKIPKANEPTSAPKAFTTKEDRAFGSVGWKVYKQYGVSGGLFLAFSVLLLSFLSAIGQVLSNWIVSMWINDSELLVPQFSNEFYIGVFGGLVLVTIILTMLRGFLFSELNLRSSTSIHNSIFKNVMHAPMSFFDTTPMGRILNRFSSDLDKVDDTLPENMFPALHYGINTICTIGLIIGAIPWFGVSVVPIFAIFFWITRYYTRSSRELRRLESIAVSPIMAHLSASLKGVSSIRAYGSVDRFTEQYRDMLNRQFAVAYAAEVGSRWIGLRMDALAILIVSITAMVSMLTRDVISPAIAGLALTYAFQMTGAFQFAVRSFADTDSQMVSVERLLHYAKEIPQEAPYIIDQTNPPFDWPKHGTIKFSDVYVKYDTSDEPVLKGISFDIKKKQKIGIVGRTGAGKSSLTLALFRMMELMKGKIYIDGVDISTLGLQQLRSKLAIIPQDPVLFLGTIRSNLDPWNEHSDEKLWETLEKVHMKKVIEDAGLEGLYAPVSEGGSNFSVGQRQLICVARALLQYSKILIMDEATASIDVATDTLIQRTIREGFADHTVLTIAHRLHTIIDSDMIMVLDKGKLVEFDTPYNLLQIQNGHFWSLVHESDSVELFYDIASGKKKIFE
eukprot:TRINITY_DN73_c2_g1_i1.p1 TRINITY_DN73_c2_g1~~TRINITY_DN73_c2_g1_i1.p1  ORF type:complete len:1092 (+),score=213.81 TRINITY_DN73_c2_g1_i1:119-3394(+)